MIRSKEDLTYYLDADMKSCSITRKRPSITGDDIWKYQRALRKHEYFSNYSGKHSLLAKVFKMCYGILHSRKGRQLGFTIPVNTFGPGLSIGHPGTIVVNPGARIGNNCRIHTCVNIGTEVGESTSENPIIGNNVYIGPGAKIYGKIRIDDNIAIGANSVVNRSFETPNVTLAGIPAKEVSKKGSNGLLILGTELVKRIE